MDARSLPPLALLAGLLAGFLTQWAVTRAPLPEAVSLALVLLAMAALGLGLAPRWPRTPVPAAVGAWLGALLAYEMVPVGADEEAPLSSDPVVFLVMASVYLGFFALPVLAGGWLGGRLRRGRQPVG